MLLLLLACQPAPVDDTGDDPSTLPVGDIDAACMNEAATVELGTGDTGFVPLADGDHVTMVHGPQGGWHVLASARVAYTLDVVAITYTIDALGSEVSWNRYVVDLVPEDTCVGAYAGMYGYLDVSRLAEGDADTPPELLVGAELTLTLVIEDHDGRTATDSRTVIADPDPADVDAA